MKNVYLFALATCFIGVGHFIVFVSIGSYVVPDDTLVKPFWLVPVGLLFFAAGVLTAIGSSGWALFHDKKNADMFVFCISFGFALWVVLYFVASSIPTHQRDEKEVPLSLSDTIKTQVCDEYGNVYESEEEAIAFGLAPAQYGATYCPGYLIEKGIIPNSRDENMVHSLETDISASYTDGNQTVFAVFHTVGASVTFTHPAVGTVTLPVAVLGSGARFANEDESVIFLQQCTGVTITKNGEEVFRGLKNEEQEFEIIHLTEKEARTTAEASCIKGGEALSDGVYNASSNTWWFDANLNATREGCNPACVVSEETKTAEINWRCTGLLSPDQPVSATPPVSQCGIENCHGLDIVCGANPADTCTMMYQLGDTCRQFAECGQVDGVCQQIENPQFTACKHCVQKCEADFPNDSEKAFACESTCGE